VDLLLFSNMASLPGWQIECLFTSQPLGLAQDDSAVARMMIEQHPKALGIPYAMFKTRKEVWELLQVMGDTTKAKGKTIRDKVLLVLTDLEMPEMDGFMLICNIEQDPRVPSLPVIIHFSLTGATNEGQTKRLSAHGQWLSPSPITYLMVSRTCTS
jgi:two-component system, chemotaxis family, chemotaxis protein CheV